MDANHSIGAFRHHGNGYPISHIGDRGTRIVVYRGCPSEHGLPSGTEPGPLRPGLRFVGVPDRPAGLRALRPESLHRSLHQFVVQQVSIGLDTIEADSPRSRSKSGAWRVGGTQGTLAWDGSDHLRLETVRRPDGPYEPGVTHQVDDIVAPDSMTGHARGLGAIVDALQASRTPETVAHENLLSLAMVEAAVRSSRERRTVEIAHVLAEAGWDFASHEPTSRLHS